MHTKFESFAHTLFITQYHFNKALWPTHHNVTFRAISYNNEQCRTLNSEKELYILLNKIRINIYHIYFVLKTIYKNIYINI